MTTRRFGDPPATSASIETMIVSRGLLARGDDAVLRATLRITPGTTFTAAPATVAFTGSVMTPVMVAKSFCAWSAGSSAAASTYDALSKVSP